MKGKKMKGVRHSCGAGRKAYCLLLIALSCLLFAVSPCFAALGPDIISGGVPFGYSGDWADIDGGNPMYWVDNTQTGNPEQAYKNCGSALTPGATYRVTFTVVTIGRSEGSRFYVSLGTNSVVGATEISVDSLQWHDIVAGSDSDSLYFWAVSGQGSSGVDTIEINWYEESDILVQLVTPDDAEAPAGTMAITATNLTSTSVTLTVAAATDACEPIYYEVNCVSDANFSQAYQTSRTFNITHLTTGTAYTFKARAKDSVTPTANVSEYGAELVVTPASSPTVGFAAKRSRYATSYRNRYN